MNEHLNSKSTRNTEVRNNPGDQQYSSAIPGERGRSQAGLVQVRPCGLDTGARGWRYVYQTH